MRPNPIRLVSLLEGEIRTHRQHRLWEDHVEEAARREASGETKPADTLTLDFQLPEL